MKLERVKVCAVYAKHHPIHILLGALMLAFGVYMIVKPHFFTWPFVAMSLVNVATGVWSIFSGLGLLYVAIMPERMPRANQIWLMSAAGELGWSLFMEIAHAVLGLPPHTFAMAIMLCGYLLLTFILASKHE